MARKAVQPPLALFAGTAPPPRALPPGIQNLFLPALVRDAAHNAQIDAYEPLRMAAFEVFVSWVKKARSGELLQFGEQQLEQDLTTGMLPVLGFQTQGMVLTGQPWSAQPKWSFANAGIANAALGRFEVDPIASSRATSRSSSI
jgi:hypothetical protein